METENKLLAAIHYLKKDPVHHVDMLQPIRRGTADIVAADVNGVLLREKASQIYLLTAKTAQDAARFMEHINGTRLMAVHQGHSIEEASKRFGLEQTMCCYQAAWLHPMPPSLESPSFHIQALSKDRAHDISALYSHNIGLEYIKGRLCAGEIFGAFKNSQLAGFIGLHEEGSMGMLEVHPSFRRMGVGSLLLTYLCTLLIEKGLTPFSQFTVENESSRRLHESLGFSVSNDCVYWLEPTK